MQYFRTSCTCLYIDDAIILTVYYSVSTNAAVWTLVEREERGAGEEEEYNMAQI